MSVFAHIAFARCSSTGALVAASELFQMEQAEHVCVACGGLLSLHYARKGVAHFQHQTRSDCLFGAGEGLRAAAVALIAREKTICTPSLRALARKQPRTKAAKAAAKPIPVEHEVWSEGWPNIDCDGVRLDYLAETLAGKLGVHISLQGEPARSIREQMRDLPFPVLEVVLRKPDTLRTFAALHAAVIDGAENKRWLSHPALEMELTPLERQLGWAPSPVPLDGAPAARARLTVKVPPRGKAVLEDFAENDVFRQLPTHRKIEVLERRMGRKQANWPAAADFSVTGGASFGVDVQIWQVDVFTRFVSSPKLRERRFNTDQVAAYLAGRYEVTPPFPNADRVAIYKYMVELVQLGYLADLRAQRYEVLRVTPARAKGKLIWQDRAQLAVSTLRHEAAVAGLRLPLDEFQRLLEAFDECHPAESVESFVAGLAYRLHAPPVAIVSFLKNAGLAILAEDARHDTTGELF